jgi:hypothetical protein
MGTDLTGLGGYEPTDYLMLRENKNNAIVTIGQVCDTDSNGLWRVCPTTGFSGPYGVATKSKLAADADLSILTEGTIVVRADGAIKPGKYVSPSGTTTGEVIAYVPATIGGTPGQSDVQAARDDWKSVIGRYVGKPGEVGPGELATDAADGDLIIIRLGGR